MLYSDTKVVPIVNVGKNLGEANKNSLNDEKVHSLNYNESTLKKEILPKINLAKKEVIVIKEIWFDFYFLEDFPNF